MPPVAFEQWLKQAGHRLGSLAYLVLLAGVAAGAFGKIGHANLLPAIAFALAEAGVLAGFVAWWIAIRRPGPRGEARGVMIFSLLVLLGCAALIVAIRKFGWGVEPMPR